MQPPPPRKPTPPTSLGHESQQRPAPARHPQAPPDLLPDQDATTSPHLVGTCDHALIRAWAAHHGAEPATGEASASGPATATSVNDQGAGIRFNFPAASRFRPLDWAEWLAHFDGERLVFVFEADRDADASSYERFGGAFYRLVPLSDWGDRPLAAGPAT